MDPRHDWGKKTNKKLRSFPPAAPICHSTLALMMNHTVSEFVLGVCVASMGVVDKHWLTEGERQWDCAPSHRRSAPTVAALSPRSHTRTWRNSSTSSHSLRRPRPRRPHLHRRSRRRCLRRHHHHHPLRLRYRDDPRGWRSCRRACRRSLGARWRCRWTRWSASSACPPWCAWPTVRIGPFFARYPRPPARPVKLFTRRGCRLCESPANRSALCHHGCVNQTSTSTHKMSDKLSNSSSFVATWLSKAVFYMN